MRGFIVGSNPTVSTYNGCLEGQLRAAQTESCAITRSREKVYFLLHPHFSVPC